MSPWLGHDFKQIIVLYCIVLYCKRSGRMRMACIGHVATVHVAIMQLVTMECLWMRVTPQSACLPACLHAFAVLALEEKNGSSSTLASRVPNTE